MDKLSQRVAALTPEQRELLALRARKRLPDVVIPREEQVQAPRPARAAPQTEEPLAPEAAARDLAFSLMFFSDAGFQAGTGKYQLLLDCARFADRHGFEAIWTPERHFQSFGGLFPNPSVLSAALAMITERLQIRAGSLVLPLHNPIRVAEDWLLLDNLSGGRVGVSFATGWHPVDFALAPEAYAERRSLLLRGIETIRRIWAEGVATAPGIDGEPIDLPVLPRPLQAELPVWITSSGTPETWVQAGALGANILSAAQGDPAVELAHRIRLYREARQAHGHDPETGRVTVMMHTFLGPDLDTVRELVRPSMIRYLKTFVAQARSFDLKSLGVEPESVEDRDLESLAAFVFERYFAERSLLGPPGKCARMVRLLKRIGVDEVACLVDFGLDAETVLEGLLPLNDLREEQAHHE